MLSTSVIVTDDIHHLHLIDTTLTEENTNVVHFQCENFNSDEILQLTPQMIVVDSSIDNMEMLTMCQELRNSAYSGLLLIITDKSDKSYQLFTLNMGVDGVFSWEDGQSLVLANLQALLRRFTFSSTAEILQFGNLTIDRTKRDAFLAGCPIHLSTMEFKIIWFLAQFSGEVVSRNKIHHGIYNAPYNGYDRSIDLYVSRIRQKIGDTPTSPNYVKTVRGIGYQFVTTDDSQNTGIMDTN